MINIIIKIDNRETSLFNNLILRDLDKYKDFITIKKEQLDAGDIIIYFNDVALVYERKTVRDLLSSIKDARYHEQKARMMSNFSNINYIIEGDDIISSKNPNNQNVLSSIYLHSIYRDKINIIFTKTIEETATFILILATKISDAPDKFVSSSKETSFIDNCKIKLKKIENIDKDTCYLMQLSQIPYISKEIAKKIMSVYPTLRSLITALDSTENKIKLLTDIDGIGVMKANKILDYI
jgi:ERCC4-type nuclease